MKCQSCGSELVEATGPCSRCGEQAWEADGTLGNPGEEGADSESEALSFEPVLSIGDPGALVVAQSVLRGAGVEFVVRGDGVQDLFGAGRLGFGFNPLTGPAVLAVASRDVDRARELLSELVDEGPSEDGESMRADAGTGAGASDGGEGDPSGSGASREGAELPTPGELTVFRSLVLVHVLLGVLRRRLETGFDLLPWSLIEEIDRFLEPNPLWETFADLMPAVFVLHLASEIGLLATWGPARKVYAGLWIWWLLSLYLGPAGVDFGGDAALRLIERLLGGVILAFCFYGPVARAFTARRRS